MLGHTQVRVGRSLSTAIDSLFTQSQKVNNDYLIPLAQFWESDISSVLIYQITTPCISYLATSSRVSCWPLSTG